MNEIVRKFVLINIPNLDGLQVFSSQRFILFRGDGVELRIQKVGQKYEMERKVSNGEFSRETFLCPLTSNEFDLLKSVALVSIDRDSYILQTKPEIALRIYHGDYEGLVRIEVEFPSEKEAREFIPPSWYGPEITYSVLGHDGKLAFLSKEDFNKELLKIKSSDDQG